MRFNNERPIFLQIAEYLSGEILGGRLSSGDRIPSARELAASLEVNPNTAARALQALADSGMARCERGTGYFVDSDGKAKAVLAKRMKFFDEELPLVFRTMDELQIRMDEVASRYEQTRTNGGTR